MTAGKYFFTFEAGTTVERTLTYKDANGTLVDTAGYQAKMHIRADIADATPVLEASTANGRITVGRVNTGTVNEYNFKISIPPSVTGTVTDFGKGLFDIEATDPTGRIVRLVQDFCQYSPQVTRE